MLGLLSFTHAVSQILHGDRESATGPSKYKENGSGNFMEGVWTSPYVYTLLGHKVVTKYQVNNAY